jgi:hypothetical protein
MKQLSYFLCVMVLAMGCTSADQLSKAQVPAVVKQTLAKEYLGVKNLQWFKENDNYVAKFRRANYQHVFVYEKQGKLLHKTEGMSLNNLPTAIKIHLKQAYPQYQLREAALVVEQKDTLYKAEIQRGMKFYEVFFDKKMKLVGYNSSAPENKSLDWNFGLLKSL